MKLSVIIPLFNEQDNVVDLISVLKKHLDLLEHELIFVDDGSTDKTSEILNYNKQKHDTLITLNRNYGQSAAIKAGIDHSSGEIIATMDGDLQNNPADIEKMVQILQKTNADIVQGFRKKRKDSFSKRVSSTIANWFIRLMFNTKLHDVGCSLKIFKRQVIKDYIFFNGFHRYFSLIAAIKGSQIIEVEVTHSSRKYGKSKYGFSRIIIVIYHLLALRFCPEKLQSEINYS